MRDVFLPLLVGVLTALGVATLQQRHEMRRLEKKIDRVKDDRWTTVREWEDKLGGKK